MILHESIIHYLGYIIIGISLLLAIYSIIDAQKRDMEDATKWFLIVFFFNILGFIAYIIMRPKIAEE